MRQKIERGLWSKVFNCHFRTIQRERVETFEKSSLLDTHYPIIIYYYLLFEDFKIKIVSQLFLKRQLKIPTTMTSNTENFNIFLRLKLMQIASLISNDGFMSSLNVSIPTDDFVERLDDFVSFWYYGEHHPDFPDFTRANWTANYDANFTRVLHPKGFCYTFNYPDRGMFSKM